MSEHQQLLLLLIHVNEYTFFSGLSLDIFQVSFMPLCMSHSQGNTVLGTFQTKSSSRFLKLPQQMFSALGEMFATHHCTVSNVLTSEDHKKKIAYYLEDIAHNCKREKLHGKL